MGKPRLGEGGVCNTEETCMQLADRNHARARGRQRLVARQHVRLANQRSLVAMGEPRLGKGGVCNTEETCHATGGPKSREGARAPVAGREAAGPASPSEVSSRNGRAAVGRRLCLQH